MKSKGDTMTNQTPAQYADIRSGKLMEHNQRSGFGVLSALIVAVVFWIVGIGWLAFSESIRCDPCEWIAIDAPTEGWL
jgi:hypothetical protein